MATLLPGDQPPVPQASVDNSLPPEYQAQIDAARKKQMLAQMLFQMAQSNHMPQQQGAIASRASPLAALAPAISAYFGQKLDSQGTQGVNDIRQKYATDEANAIQQFQGLPPDQQQAAGQLSPFNRVRSIATALQAQRDKRLDLGVNAAKDFDPSGAVKMAQTGMIPVDYSVPPAVPPAVQMLDNPNMPGTKMPMVVNTGKGGIQTGTMQQGGTTINMPGQEGQQALSFLKSDLENRQKGAASAKDTLNSNAYILDALQQGAQAGGGEGMVQALRKGLQAVGITPPATASTEQLQMALGHNILDNAKKLAPVTENDIKQLEKELGSVSTDPNALVRMLAYTQALATKGLSGFQDYVQNQTSNLKLPEAQALFTGAGMGYEPPSSLSGPQPFQMETVRNLKNLGYDITKLRDPSGQPFAADSQFHVNPTAGFSGLAQPQAPAQKPLTIDQLSPAQKAQLLQLLNGKQ